MGLASPVTEAGIVFDPPITVEPLDLQLGAAQVEHLPEALRGSLFADDLFVYAILDSARIFGLPEILENSGLDHACLYSGKAATDLADVAPYIVALTPTSHITRRIFTAADQPQGWWQDRPGAFIRSRHSIDEIRGHLRKYTRLQTDTGGWMLFRFWEADSLLSLMRESSAKDQKSYFALDHDYCAVRQAGRHSEWLRMRWAS